MRRIALVAAVLLFGIVGQAWAAGPVRIDLAALAVTDGPSGPGFSLGADVPFGSDWAYSLRASRVADDDADATSLTAGLEYSLTYAKSVVPYVGARVGARWASEEDTVCVAGKKKHSWSTPPPVCHNVNVESDGLLYQATVGVNIKPRARIGATAEAAYNGGEGEGVEFLVGVTIRP